MMFGIAWSGNAELRAEITDSSREKARANRALPFPSLTRVTPGRPVTVCPNGPFFRNTT